MATTWQPTPADLAWCAGLLHAVKDGAIWGTTNGVYRIEHTGKRLVLTARAPHFDPELHERNVIAFGRLGYTVTEEEP